MNKVVAVQMIVGGFTFCLLSASAVAEFGTPELYDDFNAKKIDTCKGCLDSAKWSGSQRGTYVGEVLREVKGKRAVLEVRGWGSNDEDEGSNPARNRLHLIDEPENIVGVCITPRVKKWELNSCPSNEDEDAVGRARIRYSTRLYDTDSPDDNDDGVIYVGFQLTRSTDDESTLKSSEFHAVAWAIQCGDETCTSENWGWQKREVTGDLDFGIVNKNNKMEFCINYDPVDHRLLFSVGPDERVFSGDDDDPLPARANWGHPDRVMQTIETRVDVENCNTDGKKSAYIIGDVDDVKVVRRDS